MPDIVQTGKVRFAAFEVDLSSCELLKHGIRIKLQDQPFQILALLLERPGVLVAREDLRRKLWAVDTFVDFDAGLNAAIRRLRDALNDSADAPRYIETLPRHGYRFIAPVEAVPEPKPQLTSAMPRDLGNVNGEEKSSRVEVVGRDSELAGLKKKLGVAWIWTLAIGSVLLAITALTAPAWRSRLFSTHASSSIRSLAVLPLQNLSGDPNQEYFADGMTDALITDLAQSKSLRVISRTSAMRYKRTQKKLPEIARELNVDAVVEGVVIRSGDRVRIDAQLIRADNDQHLWAKSYDRQIRDVLSLQADVAEAITNEIAIKLSQEDRSRLAGKKQDVDPKVYEAYLKGRYFANRSSHEDLKKSVAYFHEAIQLDQRYAPAYSGLADVYTFIGFGWGDIENSHLLAIEAAKKAISLDDSLAEAHASLGWVLHRHMQDWAGAEKEYRRAIQLNPNSAIAHQFYGAFRRSVGQTDLACGEFKLAHELDPLNPITAPGWARCLYESDHFAEAVQMMQGMVEIHPNTAYLRWNLGELYERRGMFPEAIAQYKKGVEVSDGNIIMCSLLLSAYAGWGKTAEAEKLHQEFIREGDPKWFSSIYHARMGQKEQAIRELTEEVESCKPGTCGPAHSLYVSEWRFDPLRSDPRFQAVLKRFNYPETAFKK